MVELKTMLDTIDKAAMGKSYVHKIKFHGNKMYSELEKIFNSWLSTMATKDEEKAFFYVCGIKKDFNDIMNESSADMPKMAILKSILSDFKNGELLGIEDEEINMIKSVKPDSIKKI